MLRIRNKNAEAVTARLWAEVDLDAVADNASALRARLRPGCELMAVVKADGYGHGAVAVAQAALNAGAARLGVGDAGEGVRLRTMGIAAPIHVIGPSGPGDVAAIVRHRLVASVCDPALAALLDRKADGALREPLDVEIEIDTGMRRHGVRAADAVAFVRSFRAYPRLRVVGVYTHFAAGADDGDGRASMLAQLAAFEVVRAELRDAGHVLRAHAANTLGTLLVPEAHLDCVRIGGGLYGIGTAGLLPLRPALCLRTRIAALRPVAAGDRVGYGGLHSCPQPTTLALLPCGYADGLSRLCWNGAEVLIRGRRARVVGNVSMNQMVVDAGGLDGAEVGDEVVLLGRQGADRLTAEDRARSGLSPYEVTALLRPDLLRVYRTQRVDAAQRT